VLCCSGADWIQTVSLVGTISNDVGTSLGLKSFCANADSSPIRGINPSHTWVAFDMYIDKMTGNEWALFCGLEKRNVWERIKNSEEPMAVLRCLGE
jgi:hypothetical protein